MYLLLKLVIFHLVMLVFGEVRLPFWLYAKFLSTSKCSKGLVVFDMDSTLIQQEADFVGQIREVETWGCQWIGDKNEDRLNMH